MKFDDLVTKAHWINKVSDTHYELFLDHHSLSTFRSCEQYFQHTMMEGWAAKGKMPWFFAIGILFHEFVEDYYKMKELQTLDPEVLIAHAVEAWNKALMDKNYWEDKGMTALGGLPGYCALILQYCNFYQGDMERLRPIATEIAFGKDREVKLGTFFVTRTQPSLELHMVLSADYELIQVDCYLTGRIDFLMDNGKVLGPLDHKTTAAIIGDPLEKYDPQDGMTGYIFATKAIITKNFPELARERKLNMMWMNFVGISNQPDANKRFKRLPLHKTDWQLEEYRLRNLTTFRRIFEMIYFEQPAQWNTGVCGNMFRRDCQFKKVHRQSDLNSAFLVMSTDFVQKPIWNPANPNAESE